MSDRVDEIRAQHESVLGQRVADGRATGERAPTYRGEMLHYREDFGTTMDDAQYAGIVASQEEFKNSIASAQDGIDSSRANAEEAYNNQKNMINSASFEGGDIPSYDDAVKAEGAVPIRFFEEQQLLGTHYVSEEQAQEYLGALEENEHDYTGVAEDEIGGYWVNVKGMGKELHHPFVEAEAQGREAYQSQVDYQLSRANEAFEAQRSSALSILDSEYKVASDSLALQQRKIDEAIGFNRDQLSTIKNKYSKKLENMRGTISDMFKGGSK